MMRRIVCLFILLFFSQFVFSQSKCEEGIVKLMADFEKKSRPASGEVYFMHYQMTMKAVATQPALNSTVEIKQYTSPDRQYILSSDFEIYTSKEKVICVIPSQKKIMIINQKAKEGNAGNQGLDSMMKVLNKTFLKNISSVSCNPIANGKDTLQSAKVIFTKKISDLYGIKSMDFTYDPATNFLQKLKWSYTQSSSFRSGEMQYFAMNWDYKGLNMNAPIDAMIYSSDGKLLKKYTGYQVIKK